MTHIWLAFETSVVVYRVAPSSASITATEGMYSNVPLSLSASTIRPTYRCRAYRPL